MTRLTDAMRGAMDAAAPLEPEHDPPHESFVHHVPTEAEVARVFREYWMPLLRTEGGEVSIERLRGELYDAWFLVNEARKVYRHVTGGLMDDLTASAEGVIELAERRVQQRMDAAMARATQTGGR